jgi:anti-sigma factor RsiW
MSENENLEPSVESPVDELLTSYLDDELAPDERALVEQRLTQDPAFRGQLNHMQRAWDLLDALQRSEASRDFTRTTVEMVAVKAADDAQAGESTVSRRGLGMLLAIAGAVLTASTGFFAVYAALDAPNRRLISDLPVIEKLDEYRYADSIDFLETLDKEGLFLDEEATQ